MKFKRENAMNLHKIYGGSYYDYDILRQTTIERLSKEYYYLTKEQFMKYILQQTAIILDKIIKE